MSEFNKYSTDGGITFIDVEDTNGRTMSEQLIRDTVGWTGKNLIPFPYTASVYSHHGIDYTVDENGVVDADGTATGGYSQLKLTNHDGKLKAGNYILSGSGQADCYIQAANVGGIDVKSYTGETAVAVPADYTNMMYAIVIPEGKTVNHVKFYPMLRRATISNNTYERYHDNVAEEIAKYKKGDTIKGRLYFANITAGQTEIQMVVSGKFNTDITGASIVNNGIRIRGVNGYLKTSGGTDINGLNFADYFKVSQVVPVNDQLYIAIRNTNDGAFQNATNNTIVSVGSDNPITITLS